MKSDIDFLLDELTEDTGAGKEKVKFIRCTLAAITKARQYEQDRAEQQLREVLERMVDDQKVRLEPARKDALEEAANAIYQHHLLLHSQNVVLDISRESDIYDICEKLVRKLIHRK